MSVAPLWRENAGNWCANNDAFCELVWWCGPTRYVLCTLLGMALFGGLFLFVMFAVYPRLEAIIERNPSTVPHETGAAWFAWHVQSVVHAVIVTTMSIGAVVRLSALPPAAQFDAPSSAFPTSLPDIAMVANGSHVFFCFLLVDTIVTFARKAMTTDYFAHHVIFTFSCVLIQYECFAGQLAACLLLMEISTIFLNGFSFFRHRLGYGHWWVKLSFILFATTFMVFRLFGTTYIAISFASEVFRGVLPFAGIARWRLHLICATLMVAVGLQVFWAYSIASKLLRVMGSQGKSDGEQEVTNGHVESVEPTTSVVGGQHDQGAASGEGNPHLRKANRNGGR